MPRTSLRATLFTAAAFLIGIALFLYILRRVDLNALLAGIAAAGWGILWVSLYRLVTLFAHGMGWRALFPPNAAPRFSAWFRARWAGEAINSLLPVAQVGGDVARAAMVARYTSGPIAAAATTADFTLGLIAQFVYTLLGVAILANTLGPGGRTSDFALGLVAAAVVLAAFWFAQKSNLLARLAARAAKVGGEKWTALAGNVSAWSRETAALYADRPRVLHAFAWRLAGWLLLTGETWLILYFLGATPAWHGALMLESLSMAIRSAAFAIPAALGAQEGGIVLLAAAAGISPETALALAVIKRIREIVVGIPGLLLWAAGTHKS